MTPGPDVRFEAAERYDRGKESWLLEDFARRLADAANVTADDRVLDVGCGTGIVAMECARRVGRDGAVFGVDISDAMLALARRLAPEVGWCQGDAEELPFPDESFDRVLSQLALMFIPNKEKALSEMWRVLRPGGSVAVAVLGPMPAAYRHLAELVARRVDAAAGAALESRFVLGDRGSVERIFAAAGLDATTLDTVWGVQRFRSPAVFVDMEVHQLNDAARRAVADDIETAIGDQLAEDGEVEIPVSLHIVTSVKSPNWNH
jgi:SAM-dependent methyltransferase